MAITINQFNKGASSSPLTTDGAYSKSVNLDVFSRYGIARINPKAVKKSDDSGSDEVTEQIVSFARDPDPKNTSWFSPSACSEEWTNCDNAYSSDDTYAVNVDGDDGDEQYAAFSVSIDDSAEVTGIEVGLEGYLEEGSGDEPIRTWISVNDGVSWGDYREALFTESEDTYILGGKYDKWGRGSISGSDLNGTTSAIQVKVRSYEATYDTYLDHIRVRVYYKHDDIYAGGDDGNIYKSTDGGDSWTLFASSKGRNIAIWKGYLIGALNNGLHFYNLTSGDWEGGGYFESDALQGTSEHQMMVSENDGKLYICDGEYVSTLQEDTTFDVQDSSTYTFNSPKADGAALTLYGSYVAVCLVERKEDVLVGAVQGIPSDPQKSSSIFIWDRGGSGFDFPIFLTGEFVTGMVNIQNQIYIVTDKYGKIYRYSEAGVSPVVRLPFDYIDGNIRIGNKGYSSFALWRDKFILGVSSEDGLSPAGIYGIKDGKVNCENTISSGEEGDNDDVVIGAVYPYDSNNLLYGWYDAENSNYGIDKISISGDRETGYAAYLESLLYPVGEKLNKGSIDRVEVQLAKSLTAGQGVRIKYRRNIDDDWTILGTQEYDSGYTNQSSLIFPGIKNIENIQIRVELTTLENSTTTPHLLAVRLI